MKIYIVTSSYDDYYAIKKVFLDKSKAEKFAKWCPDSYDILECETFDDKEYLPMYRVHGAIDLDSDQIYTHVEYTYHDENDFYSEQHTPGFKYVYFDNPWMMTEGCGDNSRYVLCIMEYFNTDFNEDYYTEKIKKSLRDLKPIALDMLTEGWPKFDAEEMLTDIIRGHE